MARIEWSAVGRGALAGVGLLAPLALLVLLLERSGISSGIQGGIALLVAVAAFVLAGGVAGQVATGAPRSNGLVAGAGTLALWAVLLLVIVLAALVVNLWFGGDLVEGWAGHLARAAFEVTLITGYVVLVLGFRVRGRQDGQDERDRDR